MRLRGDILGSLGLITSPCSKCRCPSSPCHEELLRQVVVEEHGEDGDDGKRLEFYERLRNLLPSTKEVGTGAGTRREKKACGVG